MDFKDLMAGDLVYVVRGYDKHLTIEKVKGIIADEDKPYPVTIFTGETVSLNDIKPIPLTEEILVKNGFEKGKTISGTELFCCEVTHQLAGDGFEIQRITIYPNWVVYAETATGIVRLGINYVHTLQHLLCLCGIEKELTI